MGPSMLPNFNMTGDIVAVDHITPRFKGYDLGDVVVCISPCVPGRAVLKRILGLVSIRSDFFDLFLCLLANSLSFLAWR